MKRCNKCGQIKPVTEFFTYANKHGAIRLKSHCKSCVRERVKARYAVKRDEVMAYQRDYAKLNPTKIKAWARKTYIKGRRNRDWCIERLVGTKRTQAKRSGTIFTITGDDVRALFDLQKGRCVLTGRELEWGGEKLQLNTLSIDRIEPALGYTPDNIRLVVYHANRARWSYSDADLLALARDLVHTLGHQIGGDP